MKLLNCLEKKRKHFYRQTMAKLFLLARFFSFVQSFCSYTNSFLVMVKLFLAIRLMRRVKAVLMRLIGMLYPRTVMTLIAPLTPTGIMLIMLPLTLPRVWTQTLALMMTLVKMKMTLVVHKVCYLLSCYSSTNVV